MGGYRLTDVQRSICAKFLEEATIIDDDSMGVAVWIQMIILVTHAEQFLDEGGATGNRGGGSAPGDAYGARSVRE